MLSNTLTISVVQTLAFFDVFNHPLTAEELYACLWQPPTISFSDFVRELDQSVHEKKIALVGGYYCFIGREETVVSRQRAHHRSESKMRRGRRAARWLARVPFVRGVAICNTVAFGWPRAESDIDVVVIVKNERLWTARFLATILLTLTRFRRHHTRVADRVCLSFYVTEAALAMAPIALEAPDIYLLYWLTHLVPIYDNNKVFLRMEQENSWVRRFLPYATFNGMHTHYAVQLGWLGRTVKKLAERLLSSPFGMWLDLRLKSMQRYKMKKNVQSVQDAPDTRVIISDNMLKFHENDRRMLYREAWLKKVAEYQS